MLYNHRCYRPARKLEKTYNRWGYRPAPKSGKNIQSMAIVRPGQSKNIKSMEPENTEKKNIQFIGKGPPSNSWGYHLARKSGKKTYNSSAFAWLAWLVVGSLAVHSRWGNDWPIPIDGRFFSKNDWRAPIDGRFFIYFFICGVTTKCVKTKLPDKCFSPTVGCWWAERATDGLRSWPTFRGICVNSKKIDTYSGR